MITLIIVDPQYDFIEGGKLPVNGGTKALDNIAKLINSGEVGNCLVSRDWHPGNHCSFKDFGGQFPEHCVANTNGARIYSPISDAITKNNLYAEYIVKGTQRYVEEFAVFNGIKEEFYDCVSLNISNDDVGYILSNREDVVVCGLAGDICVLETLKQLVKVRHKLHSLSVYVDGTASIDGGSTLRKYMIDNDIPKYEKFFNN